MKPIAPKLTAALFFLSILFAFCSKDPIVPNPKPGGTGKPTPPAVAIQFAALINLTGQPYHTSSLHAVVSVVNEKNEPVITDKTLSLTLNESVVTETLSLPEGQYRLTSFRMVHGGTYTRFAAPIAGSAKAAQVQKPLAIDFNVRPSGSRQVSVEVLKVAEGERPAAFGYPAGAFDNNQSETDPFAAIKIKSEIKIGNVLYDNSRASLTLTTYGLDGAATTSYVSIKPGVNEIKLLKAASRYSLTVGKWGTSSKLELNRADLDRDTIYTFSTEKAPKMLQSETTYKLMNSQYRPENKKEYLYDAAGKLSQVQHIIRQADGSVLRGISDRLVYEQGLVRQVSRYNDKNELTSSTSFQYDAQQKITGINHQQGNETTTGTVSYLGAPVASMGIHFKWSKPGYGYETNHYKTFNAGNVTEDGSNSTNHTSERGMYDFDDQINPYFFLQLPDLHLSNQNKNNITNQYMYFEGFNPEAAPYRSEYTYDADGYPTQVIRHYKSNQNGTWAHAYTTKTTFQYR